MYAPHPPFHPGFEPLVAELNQLKHQNAQLQMQLAQQQHYLQHLEAHLAHLTRVLAALEEQRESRGAWHPAFPPREWD